MYKIVVEPSATQDVDKACKYYGSLPIDTQRVTTKFLAELEIAFKKLATNPNFQIKTKNYRALPLKTFPYILFFTVHEMEKMVKVMALFNTYQNPEKYPT